MAESIHSSDTLTLKYLLESQSLLSPLSVQEETNPDKATKFGDGQDVWVGPNCVSDDMAAAFLGPTLWDRTLPYNDLKLEYMDVNKFLQENGIPVFPESEIDDDNDMESDPKPNQQCDENSKHTELTPVEFHMKESKTAFEPDALQNTSPKNYSPSPGSSPEGKVKVDFEPLPTDIALASVPGQQIFDPKTANFNEDELKPQPMIKKSKKVHVPDDLKDNRYWEKRKKNNVAAKRSRDARRIKENQIAIRAGYLQKESNVYKSEIQKLKDENSNLKKIIEKYENQLKFLNSQP